jgi:hypothetical protein
VKFALQRIDLVSMFASKQPSVDQLKRAVAIAEQIKELENQLAGLLGNPAAVAPRVTGRVKAVKISDVKKKRTMSPEGRARIAAAQKERWAKQKKG